MIEEIYVQELNNEFVSIKIKYLGKIDKIIEKLKNEKVILKYNGEVGVLSYLMKQLILKFPFKKNITNRIFTFQVIILKLINL